MWFFFSVLLSRSRHWHYRNSDRWNIGIWNRMNWFSSEDLHYLTIIVLSRDSWWGRSTNELSRTEIWDRIIRFSWYKSHISKRWCYSAVHDNRHTLRKRTVSAPNWSRTYDLPITTSDALVATSALCLSPWWQHPAYCSDKNVDM